MKYKVGDKVKIIDNTYSHGFKGGTIVEIIEVNNTDYLAKDGKGSVWFVSCEDIEPAVTETKQDSYWEAMRGETHKSDGGPSSYYDFPEDQTFTTLNDVLEYWSFSRWKEYSWHLANILKVLGRWGIKEGTSTEYDSRKIIYSGARLLKLIAGQEKTKEYLQVLANDPQFNLEERE